MHLAIQTLLFFLWSMTKVQGTHFAAAAAAADGGRSHGAWGDGRCWRPRGPEHCSISWGWSAWTEREGSLGSMTNEAETISAAFWKMRHTFISAEHCVWKVGWWDAVSLQQPLTNQIHFLSSCGVSSWYKERQRSKEQAVRANRNKCTYNVHLIQNADTAATSKQTVHSCLHHCSSCHWRPWCLTHPIHELTEWSSWDVSMGQRSEGSPDMEKCHPIRPWLIPWKPQMVDDAKRIQRKDRKQVLSQWRMLFREGLKAKNAQGSTKGQIRPKTKQNVSSEADFNGSHCTSPSKLQCI